MKHDILEAPRPHSPAYKGGSYKDKQEHASPKHRMMMMVMTTMMIASSMAHCRVHVCMTNIIRDNLHCEWWPFKLTCGTANVSILR